MGRAVFRLFVYVDNDDQLDHYVHGPWDELVFITELYTALPVEVSAAIIHEKLLIMAALLHLPLLVALEQEHVDVGGFAERRVSTRGPFKDGTLMLEEPDSSSVRSYGSPHPDSTPSLLLAVQCGGWQ